MSNVSLDEKNSTNYLYPLDALRGISALIVAFFTHRVFITHNDLPQMFHMPSLIAEIFNLCIQYGWLGVDLFFVLSGFIFYRNYKTKIEDKQISLKSFWLLRFSRLFPAYWVTLIVIVVIYAAVLLLNVPYDNMSFGVPYWQLSMSNFIQSVFLVQGMGLGSNLAFNGPAWSLVYEMFAYLLFFIIATKSKRENGILLFAIPVFVGLIIANREYLGNSAGLPFPLLNYDGGQRLLISFFMGCLTCEANIHLNNAKVKTRLIFGIVFGLITILIPICFWIGNYVQGIVGDSALVSGMLWFPCMVTAVLINKRVGKFLSIGVFRWLGNISYSVYIWHLPIANIVLLALNLAGYIEYRDSPILYIIWCTTTIVVAHLSHYCLERPIQRLIRKKLR